MKYREVGQVGPSRLQSDSCQNQIYQSVYRAASISLHHHQRGSSKEDVPVSVHEALDPT